MIIKSKKILSIIRIFSQITYKENKAYNINFILMILGNILNAVISYSIWYYVFVYSGQSLINDYAINEIFPYIFLMLAGSLVTNQSIDVFISKSIKSGNIINDLLKPISIMEIEFSRGFGNALFFFLHISLPIFIFVILYMIYFSIPIHFELFLPFILSLFIGFILMFLFDYIIGLFSFYTLSNWGTSRFKQLMIEMLSGELIPIFYLPSLVKKCLKFLPFYYFSCFPVEVFLNKLSISEIIFYFIIQLIWIIILYFLSKKMWQKISKRISINGG